MPGARLTCGKGQKQSFPEAGAAQGRGRVQLVRGFGM